MYDEAMGAHRQKASPRRADQVQDLYEKMIQNHGSGGMPWAASPGQRGGHPRKFHCVDSTDDFP